MLDCQKTEEWDRLKTCLGGSWPASNYSFDEASAVSPWNDKLVQLLAQEFSRLSATEWEEVLIPAGVPLVRVAENNNDGFYLNPQAQGMNMVNKLEHPEYENLRQVGVQVSFSKTAPADKPAAPLTGQHNQEILTELGFSDDEISGMVETGCISTVAADPG